MREAHRRHGTLLRPDRIEVLSIKWRSSGCEYRHVIRAPVDTTRDGEMRERCPPTASNHD